jgi:divalent metal cation (Fe/Co/Zn/Cd) transporter
MDFGHSVILVLLILFLIPAIFYLRTLQNTLQFISPENRKMPPANVWLLFIPIFNYVWHFIIVIKLADSIKSEALKRNVFLQEGKPGYDIGIAMCVLHCCSFIPIIGGFAGLGVLVCWIIYWVKIVNYKKQLEQTRLFDFEEKVMAN